MNMVMDIYFCVICTYLSIDIATKLKIDEVEHITSMAI